MAQNLRAMLDSFPGQFHLLLITYHGADGGVNRQLLCTTPTFGVECQVESYATQLSRFRQFHSMHLVHESNYAVRVIYHLATVFDM